MRPGGRRRRTTCDDHHSGAAARPAHPTRGPQSTGNRGSPAPGSRGMRLPITELPRARGTAAPQFGDPDPGECDSPSGSFPDPGDHSSLILTHPTGVTSETRPRPWEEQAAPPSSSPAHPWGLKPSSRETCGPRPHLAQGRPLLLARLADPALT